MSRFLLITFFQCLLTGIIWGQAFPTSLPGPANSPAYLATQIIARMRDNLERLPNYTCTETIKRTRKTRDGKTVLQDTLRLEVALIDGEEIFAWPGSTEFLDTNLRNLIGGGAYGNGAFGLYAEMLFYDGGPTFVPSGTVELNGEKLLKYDFNVPRSKSSYVMSVNAVRDVVGFKGSIYADPETLDPRRLEMISQDIPRVLQLLASSDQVDYQRVKIGDESFLLPAGNVLTMVTPKARHKNEVSFADCRRFQGQSTISFADPDELLASEEQTTQEVTIPPHTELRIKIETKIDLEKTAVGDPVTGKIVDRVQVDGGESIPKGAQVNGRIIRLDRLEPGYALAILFTDIQWKGGHATMNGFLAHLPERSRSSGKPVTMMLVTADEESSPPGVSGQKVILIPRGGPTSVQGFDTYWSTY